MKNSIDKNNLTLFVFWPILSFINNIYKIRLIKNYNVLIVLLFYSLVGYTYLATEASDANRNMARFLEYANNGPTQIVVNIYGKIYEGDKIDIMIDVVSIVLVLFTKDVKFFNAALGVLYGIFFVLWTKRLLGNIKKMSAKPSLPYLFLLGTIFYIFPMEAINGRFWMAFMAYMVVVYDITIEFKIKSALWGLLIIFIHQGFAPLVIITFIFFAVKNIKTYRNQILYLLIIIAYINANYGIDFVRDASNIAGESFKNNAQGYVSEERLEYLKDSDTKINIQNFLSLPFTISFYLILIISHYNYYITRRKKSYKEKMKKYDYLFSFALLFWVLQAFVSNVPSMGGRYKDILFGILIMYNYLILTKQQTFKINSLYILFIMSYSMYMLFQIRIWSEFTSLLILIPFPWVLLIFPFDITILNIIKG